MGKSKVVVTLETATLREVERLIRRGRFPDRSRAIQTVLAKTAARRKCRRLIAELARLNPQEERALAEESFSNYDPE
jgi:Arc/MetJ-type ribon-helix-helix transcriptional regulator